MLHALWLPEITIRQGQVQKQFFLGKPTCELWANEGNELHDAVAVGFWAASAGWDSGQMKHSAALRSPNCPVTAALAGNPDRRNKAEWALRPITYAVAGLPLPP